MSPIRVLGPVCLSLALSFFNAGQQSQSTPQSASIVREAQALTILQTSLRVMGGIVPSDSVASGSVTIVAGSQTSSGSIRILTRGTDQTSEQFTLPQSTSVVIYSSGFADETINSTTASIPLERSVTSQSVLFPLPFLAAALSNPDVSIQYVGPETLGQQSVQHIRLLNTFASQPNFQDLTSLAVFEVWLNATTGLPQRISFVRRAGRGAFPGISVDAYFTSYQTVSGTSYPSQLNVSLNRTPWATINISSVTLNTGLTASSFSIQ